MKIYTKTGDMGNTGLFGGKRVAKFDLRIGACGDLDELNASLGAVSCLLGDVELLAVIERVQREIFIAGSDIASPCNGAPTNTVPRIEPEMTARLEAEIDSFTEEAGALTTFILPGGSPAGAALHLSRAICRRAERTIAALADAEPVGEYLLPYINRLSDHLFELARVVNRRVGTAEIAWSGRRGQES